MARIPLGVCTRYTETGASSRLRYYAYAGAWREAGFAPEFHPFFDDAYLRRLYAGGGKSRFRALAALGRRLALAPWLPRNLVLEYELLPFCSWALECRVLGKRRYVLNFDDDVWEKYRDLPRLADKYDQLVRHAAGVIVANELLRRRVEELNERVLLIPTAVDLERYRVSREKHRRLTLVWIGTPVTYRYLEQALPQLRALRQVADFQLLVIARRRLELERPLPGLDCRYLDWSETTEVAELAQCHIGVMPLPDEPFARGKSAYKLIQYLACGLPVIASPVGENGRVVQPGVNGYLATTPAEWAAALRELLARDHSAAARTSAEAYSLQRFRPLSAAFLQEVFS